MLVKSVAQSSTENFKFMNDVDVLKSRSLRTLGAVQYKLKKDAVVRGDFFPQVFIEVFCNEGFVIVDVFTTGACESCAFQ